MSKHTPGPWYADLYCVWAGIGRQHYVAGTCCGSGEDDEQKANARLIGSAPCLLDALRACVEVFEDPTIGPDDPDTPALINRITAAARAAIAKAEGK